MTKRRPSKLSRIHHLTVTVRYDSAVSAEQAEAAAIGALLELRADVDFNATARRPYGYTVEGRVARVTHSGKIGR